jgi:hypothetical protein
MSKGTFAISLSRDGFSLDYLRALSILVAMAGHGFLTQMSTTTLELMQGGTPATTGALVVARRTSHLVNGCDRTHPLDSRGKPEETLIHKKEFRYAVWSQPSHHR